MANPYNFRFVKNPIQLGRILWPDVVFYKQEREIIQSVWENDETVVPAGHMLGKDYTAAFICLAFFLTRYPCRVVTTSVDYSQLEGVLWGEIRRFIQTCKYPLEYERGGPLVINHMHIRKIFKGEMDGLSYLTGRVAEKGEGMSGHHIARTGDGVPRTLFVGDEASGIDDTTFAKASEWANRQLIIGNPYDCQNYFKWAVKGNPKTDDKGGDIPRTSGEGFRRRIIRIKGEDSPNVRMALAQKEAGQEPTGELVVPGVLPWEDYVYRRQHWDRVKQCVGLDADFWEGAETLMFPPEWLNRAEQLAVGLHGKHRVTQAIGVDPGEGGADTSWAAVDEYGLIELESKKTPNTTAVVSGTIAFGKRHGVDSENWLLDRGGGGKQHADRLREMGYNVRTVAFGEPVMIDPRTGLLLIEERLENRETRYTYVNRRAQMYGTLRILLDPDEGRGWAIPRRYSELRRQLAPIPLRYDREGRLELLPKNRKDPKDKRPTLTELIGRSPDDADAVVLAVHGMTNKPRVVTAGAD